MYNRKNSNNCNNKYNSEYHFHIIYLFFQDSQNNELRFPHKNL